MRPNAMMTNDDEVIPLKGFALIGGMLLLIIRGLALWLLVPAACLAWPLWFAVDRSRPTIGQVVGWVDWNFVAALQATFLRPFFSEDQRALWAPARDVTSVRHRVGWFDPV